MAFFSNHHPKSNSNKCYIYTQILDRKLNRTKGWYRWKHRLLIGLVLLVVPRMSQIIVRLARDPVNDPPNDTYVRLARQIMAEHHYDQWVHGCFLLELLVFLCVHWVFYCQENQNLDSIQYDLAITGGREVFRSCRLSYSSLNRLKMVKCNEMMNWITRALPSFFSVPWSAQNLLLVKWLVRLRIWFLVEELNRNRVNQMKMNFFTDLSMETRLWLLRMLRYTESVYEFFFWFHIVYTLIRQYWMYLVIGQVILPETLDLLSVCGEINYAFLMAWFLFRDGLVLFAFNLIDSELGRAHLCHSRRLCHLDKFSMMIKMNNSSRFNHQKHLFLYQLDRHLVRAHYSIASLVDHQNREIGSLFNLLILCNLPIQVVFIYQMIFYHLKVFDFLFRLGSIVMLYGSIYLLLIPMAMLSSELDRPKRPLPGIIARISSCDLRFKLKLEDFYARLVSCANGQQKLGKIVFPGRVVNFGFCFEITLIYVANMLVGFKFFMGT